MNSALLKIGVCGVQGRVGHVLVEIIEAQDGLMLAGGFDRFHDPQPVFEASDVIIDFSTPESTVRNAQLAQDTKTPLVACSTGLSVEDEEKLKNAAQHVPIVYASNTSLAVNVLFALVEKAAAYLPDYDIEIVEAHHNKKVDAPSGTALTLGKTAASARDIVFDDVAVLSREGIVGERKKGEIGFSTIRGGDAVGEHSVIFFGEGERIEIKQQATNRALYAQGAIRAAQWIINQKNGLYSMRDVLGI